MAAGRQGDDRLSGLGDDLLHRILHFAPARKAVSTTALSRRWKDRWLSSGAVNLETNVDRDCREAQRSSLQPPGRRLCALRDSFVSTAGKALAAAAPVTRLTIRVEGMFGDTIESFLRDERRRAGADVLADVLSHRAAGQLEELRIAVVDSTVRTIESREFEVASPSSFDKPVIGVYRLRLDALPSNTLRVLELTNCSGLHPSAAAVPFPRLASLRLRHCHAPLEILQGVIDAAPALTAVSLESVVLGETGALRCPAATALVLHKCGWVAGKHGAAKIHAPMLRRFRYRGLLRRISLAPPPPDLAQVDLTLRFHYGSSHTDLGRVRRSFWRFLANFAGAKEMKLRVRRRLEDLAVARESRRVKLLPAFGRLERLELEGMHRPAGATAAVAIANLLRCCPALRDLQIKLGMYGDLSCKSLFGVVSPCEAGCLVERKESKERSDLQESIERFKRLRSQPAAAAAAGDEDDDGVNFNEVPDLPALSRHSFECLQGCLSRVGLQFMREEEKTSCCFGVRLIKFFAENAMALEEMCIDAGIEKMYEHLNPKVERWIAAAPSSKRRRLNLNPSNAIKGVAVLPLKPESRTRDHNYFALAEI